MYVEHSGWNNERGWFSDNIYFDENKQDYTIEFNDGIIKKQSSAFQNVTADWNHDGDVYTSFGAWFHEIDSAGNLSGGEFWTPQDMVMAVIEAQDPNRPKYGNLVKTISGISLRSPEKKQSLNEQIKHSEGRALHQEVERNRKMDMLGIRPSNEPWAR